MKRYTLSLLHPLAVAAILVTLHLTGCSTDPGTVSEPPWVRDPPASRAGETLIVGYGIGPTEDDAQLAAGVDVRNQISRILLDRYDPEARGISDLTAREIERIAETRWDQLEPLDTYRTLRGDGWTEQYFLVAYQEQEIFADRDLVVEGAAELLRDSSGDDSVPESPSPVEPLRRLRELLTPVPPSSPAMRNQTLLEARELARRVTLHAHPGDIETSLGAASNQVITVRVLNGGGDPLSDDTTLRVTVTENGPDGPTLRTSTTLTVGARGAVEYLVPQPEFSGMMRVRFQPVWLEEALQNWRDLQTTEAAAVVMESVEADLTTTVRISVTSRASAIPTAVILVDRDIAGNPITTRDAARGAIQQFLDEGFRIVPVNITPAVETALAQRADMVVSDLYDILPFDVLSSVERVIVGGAGIVQFSESDGITVVIELRATAFDLRRDQRLTDIRFEERVAGRDARATLRSAFQSAGRRAARQLAPRLP